MQMAESYAHPFFVALMVHCPLSLILLLFNNIFYSFLVNFGEGPRIWIDNLDDAEGVLNEFAEYFADSSIKKVISFRKQFAHFYYSNKGLSQLQF